MVFRGTLRGGGNGEEGAGEQADRVRRGEEIQAVTIQNSDTAGGVFDVVGGKTIEGPRSSCRRKPDVLALCP